MNKTIKNKRNLTSAFIAAGFFTMLSLMPTYAEGNNAVLSGIEISSQDSVFNGSKYQITLKTDKNINIEKTSTSNDKIVLDLKNTNPSQYVNTVYNNASGIDHVIVQPVSDSEVRIFLQGSDIASSKINLDMKNFANLADKQVLVAKEAPVPTNSNEAKTEKITENTPQTVIDMSENQDNPQEKVNIVPETDKIVLTKPIDKFKPLTDNIDQNLNDNSDSASSTKNILTSISLHKIFSKNGFDWLLRLLTLAFMIVVGIKLFKPKKNIEINLSSKNIKDRDLDLIKSINSRRDLIGAGLKTGNKDLSGLSGYNSFSQYGIKEYKNSQNPPLNSSFSLNKNLNEPNFIKSNTQNTSTW